MSGGNQSLVVGSVASGGSAAYPWPEYWQWPTTTYVSHPIVQQDYANEVEVQRNEHDAVLTFYRNRNGARQRLHEITVPLGVLEWLTKEA